MMTASTLVSHRPHPRCTGPCVPNPTFGAILSECVVEGYNVAWRVNRPRRREQQIIEPTPSLQQGPTTTGRCAKMQGRQAFESLVYFTGTAFQRRIARFIRWIRAPCDWIRLLCSEGATAAIRDDVSHVLVIGCLSPGSQDEASITSAMRSYWLGHDVIRY